ncbi:MAG: hypothetical protein ACI9MC_000999 [Kiritimatiellia bacterium]|jgi:hypothetical protein
MKTAPSSPTPPPKASHAVPLVASLALVLLWAMLTWGAPWVAPMIASVAESIGFAMGVDVLPGWKEDDR